VKSSPGEKVTLKQNFKMKKHSENELVEGKDDFIPVAHYNFKNSTALRYNA